MTSTARIRTDPARSPGVPAPYTAGAVQIGAIPRLYRIRDAMRILSLSRSTIFEQIRAGRLRSVKQGRTRLIPETAIREYIELLESEVR
jgi:excisionase family DNA binding protein